MLGMSQTVALTGGSGFIGSHVADALLAAGYRVRVIDPRGPHRPDVDWRPVDLLDLDQLTAALRGTDAVFHLAAMSDVNDVYARPVESIALNALGTVQTLEAARRAGAGRVVLASSVWVYAATTGQVVDETTPFDPDTDRHLYVSSKIASEFFCRDYHTLYGRPYTILRYGIPFGPRMRDSLVIAAFIRRALCGEPLTIDGDGRQERYFVYIEDLARAHVLALAPSAENRTINLDGAAPVRIRDIAELVGELVGGVQITYGEPRPGDFRARQVRTDVARNAIDWAPRVPFAEGMRRTVDWYRGRMIATQQAAAGG
jgi:UDP-glucose 4-epimerase